MVSGLIVILCLALDPEDFPLCFILKMFVFLQFTFKSMIHFELTFMYQVRLNLRFMDQSCKCFPCSYHTESLTVPRQEIVSQASSSRPVRMCPPPAFSPAGSLSMKTLVTLPARRTLLFLLPQKLCFFSYSHLSSFVNFPSFFLDHS